MQTLTIQVEDTLMQKFISIIDKFKGGIRVVKDKNLENDPYFYERKKQLEQTYQNVHDGSMPIYDFDTSMDELINELEK
jgi:hypothetical protein